MNQGIISRRYASALWMYAVKEKQEDQVYAACKMLNHAYAQYKVLKRVLDNRMLSQEQKIRVITTVVNQHLNSVFEKFVRLVFKNQREKFLQTICLTFQNMYRTERKILNVHLVAATSLDSITEKRIIQKIAQRTGQTVSLHTKVNPAIIGGYILTTETYRLDVSVATRLRRMKEYLSESKNF